MVTLAFQSYQTTGSISASSTSLTVASNPGFAVNDYIIIEVGGESGGGLRGSEGVGGTWPALSYATTAAMNADASQAASTYCWVRTTGAVYQYITAVWTAVGTQRYYECKVIPKALCTRILGIAGSVWTLENAAVVAATTANVYYDNAYVFNDLNRQDSVLTQPPDDISSIPAGVFALGHQLVIGWHNREVFGEGIDETELFSPQGATCASIAIYTKNNCSVHDLHLRGNIRDDGYGFVFKLGPPASFTVIDNPDAELGVAYNHGIIFSDANNNSGHWAVENVKVTDVWQMAAGASYGSNVNVRNSSSYRTDGLRQYIQWDFQWADSTGGMCVDCLIDSPTLVAGFEGFRSDGVQFIRSIGRNASFSMNSTGNWLIEDCQLTIEANSQSPELSFASTVPIININSNISPPNASMLLGGTIRGPTIIQEGYVNASNDRLYGIVVNADNPNVTIEGGYFCNPSAGGLLQSPDYGGGQSDDQAIRSDSADLAAITGIRIVGNASPLGYVVLVPVGSTPISDCVADAVFGGVQTNNVTNAYYEANYSTLCPGGSALMARAIINKIGG